MTPLETLKAARELISDESAWCRRAFARNSKGDSVRSNAPDAVQFCVKGAIYNVHDVEELTEQSLPAVAVIEDLSALTKLLHNMWDCGYYNNARSHGEVLELLDTAIAREKDGKFSSNQAA